MYNSVTLDRILPFNRYGQFVTTLKSPEKMLLNGMYRLILGIQASHNIYVYQPGYRGWDRLCINLIVV